MKPPIISKPGLCTHRCHRFARCYGTDNYDRCVLSKNEGDGHWKNRQYAEIKGLKILGRLLEIADESTQT